MSGRRWMTSPDHPRLRGEHAADRKVHIQWGGSPPPARGARPVRRLHRAEQRITPACAGSTPPSGSATGSPPDHPRLRGEHSRSARSPGVRCGSPPPARGAPSQAAGQLSRVRITPACAGSTALISRSVPGGPDHPRLRGEHRVGEVDWIDGHGSPPPARGAPARPEGGSARPRITPACAGSTVAVGVGATCSPDHPRLRGEHLPEGSGFSLSRGSPPPARGAPHAYDAQPHRLRITPACAGSTSRPSPATSA